MKRVLEPNTLLFFEGKLMRVIGIGEGRTIHMRQIDKDPCGACGRHFELDVLEHSPWFQDGAEPVDTLVE